jgi:aspartate kinase
MPGTVAGVASEQDVLVLEADAPVADLLAALDEHHVAGKQLHMATDPAHITLVISRENLHDEDRVQGVFAKRFGGKVRFVSGLGAVSVIGAGINASYANARMGLAALEEAGVKSHGMSTSSFRITWMLPSAGITTAVRALHARFIEASATPVP